MTTSTMQRVSIALAMMAGLLAGSAGCGSNAKGTSSPTPSSHPGDSTRPTSKEECDACQGLWAVHGIEPMETCICKTSDVGRECLDGKDCEGECLLDGDPEFHVMQQGDPPLGYYQGHCAAYDTTFGCFAHIPDDVATALPMTAAEAGPFICVD